MWAEEEFYQKPRCEYWGSLAEVWTTLKRYSCQLPFCILSSLKNTQVFKMELGEEEAEEKQKKKKKVAET